jgi:hypothetical protein
VQERGEDVGAPLVTDGRAVPGPVRQMCARADGDPPSALVAALPSLDVVDVTLADRELAAARQSAAELDVEVSAFAVVCRRSSTWDGLGTAWPIRTRVGYG